MSLYRCTCGQWYTLPKELDDHIDSVTDDNPVKAGVVICANCGNKHVTGGELEYDYLSEHDDPRYCIMVFGRDYNEKTDVNLDEYTSVKLVETNDVQGDEFVTFDQGKTLYLKRENE